MILVTFLIICLCYSRQFMVLRCSQSAYYHTYLSTKRKQFFLLPKTERCELNSKNEQSDLKRCWKMWLQQRIPCLAFTFSSLFGFFCFFQLFVVLLFRWRIKCDPKMLHVFDTFQRWWIIKQIKKKYPSHGT